MRCGRLADCTGATYQKPASLVLRTQFPGETNGLVIVGAPALA